MSGPILSEAARRLDAHRAATYRPKRYGDAALLEHTGGLFASSSDDDTLFDFDDRRPNPAGAPPDGIDDVRLRPLRRQVPLYERPFKASTGAQQLSYAKQRIRDLEQGLQHREDEIVLLQCALSKHADLLGYLQASIMRDITAITAADELAKSRYTETVATVLDSQVLHEMHDQMKALLVSRQNEEKKRRITELEAKEQRLTQIIAALQRRVKVAEQARDDLQREVARVTQSAQSAESSVRHLRLEVQSLKQRIAEQDTTLQQKQQQIVDLEDSAATHAEELAKAQLRAKGAVDALDHARSTHTELHGKSGELLEQVQASVALALQQQEAIGGPNIVEHSPAWHSLRNGMAEAMDKARRGLRSAGDVNDAVVQPCQIAAQLVKLNMVEMTTARRLVTEKHERADAAKKAKARASEILRCVGAALDKMDQLQAIGDAPVAERETNMMNHIMSASVASEAWADEDMRGMLARIFATFTRELSAWHSQRSRKLSMSRSAREARGVQSAAGAGDDDAEADELEDAFESIDVLQDEALVARRDVIANRKKIRQGVATLRQVFERMRKTRAGMSAKHFHSLLRIAERDSEGFVALFTDPFALLLREVASKCKRIVDQQREALRVALPWPVPPSPSESRRASAGGEEAEDVLNATVATLRSTTSALSLTPELRDQLAADAQEKLAAIRLDVARDIKELVTETTKQAAQHAQNHSTEVLAIGALMDVLEGEMREAHTWGLAALYGPGHLEEEVRRVTAKYSRDGKTRRPDAEAAALDLQNTCGALSLPTAPVALFQQSRDLAEAEAVGRLAPEIPLGLAARRPKLTYTAVDAVRLRCSLATKARSHCGLDVDPGVDPDHPPTPPREPSPAPSSPASEPAPARPAESSDDDKSPASPRSWVELRLLRTDVGTMTEVEPPPLLLRPMTPSLVPPEGEFTVAAEPSRRPRPAGKRAGSAGTKRRSTAGRKSIAGHLSPRPSSPDTPDAPLDGSRRDSARSAAKLSSRAASSRTSIKAASPRAPRDKSDRTPSVVLPDDAAEGQARPVDVAPPPKPVLVEAEVQAELLLPPGVEAGSGPADARLGYWGPQALDALDAALGVAMMTQFPSPHPSMPPSMPPSLAASPGAAHLALSRPPSGVGLAASLGTSTPASPARELGFAVEHSASSAQTVSWEALLAQAVHEAEVLRRQAPRPDEQTSTSDLLDRLDRALSARAASVVDAAVSVFASPLDDDLPPMSPSRPVSALSRRSRPSSARSVRIATPSSMEAASPDAGVAKSSRHASTAASGAGASRAAEPRDDASERGRSRASSIASNTDVAGPDAFMALQGAQIDDLRSDLATMGQQLAEAERRAADSAYTKVDNERLYGELRDLRAALLEGEQEIKALKARPPAVIPASDDGSKAEEERPGQDGAATAPAVMDAVSAESSRRDELLQRLSVAVPDTHAETDTADLDAVVVTPQWVDQLTVALAKARASEATLKRRLAVELSKSAAPDATVPGGKPQPGGAGAPSFSLTARPLNIGANLDTEEAREARRALVTLSSKELEALLNPGAAHDDPLDRAVVDAFLLGDTHPGLDPSPQRTVARAHMIALDPVTTLDGRRAALHSSDTMHYLSTVAGVNGPSLLGLPHNPRHPVPRHIAELIRRSRSATPPPRTADSDTSAPNTRTGSPRPKTLAVSRGVEAMPQGRDPKHFFVLAEGAPDSLHFSESFAAAKKKQASRESPPRRGSPEHIVPPTRSSSGELQVERVRSPHAKPEVSRPPTATHVRRRVGSAHGPVQRPAARRRDEIARVHEYIAQELDTSIGRRAPPRPHSSSSHRTPSGPLKALNAAPKPSVERLASDLCGGESQLVAQLRGAAPGPVTLRGTPSPVLLERRKSSAPPRPASAPPLSVSAPSHAVVTDLVKGKVGPEATALRNALVGQSVVHVPVSLALPSSVTGKGL